MINILIVDDDQVIRCGIKKLINTNFNMQTNLFEAENGIKAIEIVCSYKIDFIIADIKMPICSGIEMIEKLHKLQYKGQIVVLSGFDDYELVRSAMKLGIVDYLLKPIVVDEFICVLNKIFSAIKTQKQVNSFYINENFKSILEIIFNKQLIMENLLGISQDSNSILIDFLAENNLKTDCKSFLCLIDAFNSYNNTEDNKLIWFSQTEKIFAEIFNIDDYLLIHGENNQLWNIIIIIKNTHSLKRELFDEFIKKLKDNNPRIGISDKFYYISQLNIANNVCRKSLDIYYYDLPEIKNIPTECYPYNNIINEIINCACSYDFVLFSKKITEMFYMINLEKPPVDDLKQLLNNTIYSIMTQNNKYISVVGKYKFTENDIFDVVLHSRSFLSLLNALIDIFNIYMNELKIQNASQDEYIIRKSKLFIEKEYMNDISLSKVSQIVSLNPNYFSTLFREKSGITFRHYLRLVRIEKAKELIKNTNLKIYDIAEKVGYKDTPHFNRAFKSICGKSPQQYRNESKVV